MHPSGWAGLLPSLLQGRGQKLDVPMPAVPLSVTPHHPGHIGQEQETGGLELCPWSPPSTGGTGERLCMVAWHSPWGLQGSAP